MADAIFVELDGYLGPPRAKGLKAGPGGVQNERNTAMWESGGGHNPQPDGVPPFLACDVLLRTNMWKWASPYAGLVGFACTSANGESRISAVVLQGGSIAPL